MPATTDQPDTTPAGRWRPPATAPCPGRGYAGSDRAGTSPQLTGRERLPGQFLRYTVIGVVMTLAYLGLYAGLHPLLGAQPANSLAWVMTAIADTAANRRVTFGRAGRAGALRAQVQGMLVFGIGLALTSGALLALAAVSTRPATWVQLGVLIVSNVLAGLVRFVLLRNWVFAR